MTPREHAEVAIEAVTIAAEAYGQARAAEASLEDARCIVKRDAIRRIMATTNEETTKQHSASSAEKIVETDATYVAFRERQREAVVATQLARGQFYAARCKAALLVALVGELAGVGAS